MIDTHSHIYGPEYDEDRELVVQRAKQAGVERILLPNINEASIEPMLSLCHSYPGYCFPMMGLHPEDVADDYSQVLDKMEKLLENQSVIKQPIVRNGKQATVGYQPDVWKKWE